MFAAGLALLRFGRLRFWFNAKDENSWAVTKETVESGAQNRELGIGQFKYGADGIGSQSTSARVSKANLQLLAAKDARPNTVVRRAALVVMLNMYADQTESPILLGRLQLELEDEVPGGLEVPVGNTDCKEDIGLVRDDGPGDEASGIVTEHGHTMSRRLGADETSRLSARASITADVAGWLRLCWSTQRPVGQPALLRAPVLERGEVDLHPEARKGLIRQKERCGIVPGADTQVPPCVAAIDLPV